MKFMPGMYVQDGGGQDLGDVLLAGLAQVIVEAPVLHPARLLRGQLVAAARAVVGRLDVRQQAREHARLAWPHALAVRRPLRLRQHTFRS